MRSSGHSLLTHSFPSEFKMFFYMLFYTRLESRPIVVIIIFIIINSNCVQLGAVSYQRLAFFSTSSAAHPPMARSAWYLTSTRTMLSLSEYHYPGCFYLLYCQYRQHYIDLRCIYYSHFDNFIGNFSLHNSLYYLLLRGPAHGPIHHQTCSR